ncbi:hypothetical protein BaRGS_00010145 [Batillaria attramentaria]|uniref:Uncharacterized protein n=1 Tax=Batillaria attramentaria TaxID=370345 RepID=A0ABD0LGB5_9CAEN
MILPPNTHTLPLCGGLQTCFFAVLLQPEETPIPKDACTWQLLDRGRNQNKKPGGADRCRPPGSPQVLSLAAHSITGVRHESVRGDC